MVLTLEELRELQSECMADDIELQLEKMSLWTKEQALRYFESGGEDEPQPAASAAAATAAAAGNANAAFKATPSGGLGRKPRVVLLHGTATNEGILRIQLAPLLRKLKEVADIHVIAGHLDIEASNPQAASMKKWFGQHQVLVEYARATQACGAPLSLIHI